MPNKEFANLQRACRTLLAEHRSWVDAEKGGSVAADEIGVAKALFESITYRAAAVEYHCALQHQMHASALAMHRQAPDRRNSLYLLRDAAQKLQFLFDDLVFNIISLFDYIGCYLGLVLEGMGKHEINWRKGMGKSKGMADTSNLYAILAEVHASFVRSLLRYRSEVSHFRRDDVEGHITTDLLGKGGDELHVTVPRWFAQKVRVRGGKAIQADETIGAVADLITGEAAVQSTRVITALATYIQHLGYRGPPSTAQMAVKRWSRAGVWERLSNDPRLKREGVEHVGAAFFNHHVQPLLTLTQSERVETAPIDVREMMQEELTIQEVVERLATAIFEHLRKGNSA